MSILNSFDRIYDTSEVTSKCPLMKSIRYIHSSHQLLFPVLWDLSNLNLLTDCLINLNFQT